MLVVGDHEDLGGWQPLQAIPLVTDKTVYPSWFSTTVVLLIKREKFSFEHIRINYKYVRDQRAVGKGLTWEDQIPNRTVDIPLTGGKSTVWLISDQEFETSGMPTVTRTAVHDPTPPLEALDSRLVTKTGLKFKLEPKSGFHSMYCMDGDSPLAKGGFSSVWTCTSKSTDSKIRFAVKLINVKQMAQHGKTLLFGDGSYAGEIAVHGRIRHPNIVELKEAFHDQDEVFLIMGCCHGGDLFEIIHSHCLTHKQGLPERTAAHVVRQLLLALAFLHENGIVHRDVKCENVLQEEARGSVPLERATFKLGDFGFATMVMPGETLYESVGSPSTCAPEVIQGLSYAQPADIWSAGATLFTMLKGRRLSHASVCSQHCTSPRRRDIDLLPGQWGSASKGVLSFMTKLLQPNPFQRASAEEALADNWLQP